ncbi:hypothetical protein [Nitrosomonas sp. sh817]|uniref:hypothetical protein n=1 Tax=Nitrosomonas sp. sh817 TaxID=3070658 RepID=UPI0027DCA4B2|nr:hypothetical protein [Nitrosomonas sp. sh817]WMJ09136.1 hypothetical protein RBH92_02750 [Nitrosomonas sp. sh817]
MRINQPNQPVKPMIEPVRQAVIDAIQPVAQQVIEQIEQPSIVANARTALLVAQVNYPRKSQANEDPQKNPATYLKMAKNYKDYLLQQGKAERVVIFDFLNGTFIEFKKGGAKDGQTIQPKRDALLAKNYRYNINGTLKLKVSPAEKQVNSRLYYSGAHELAKQLTGNEDGDISKADYDKWPGGKENSMSVSDLYEIAATQPAASLCEVHFIGHAIADGPVIVNTPNYKRKQFDKDARRDDFTDSELAHVFGGQELAKFQAAFTNDAFLVVWGCEASRYPQLLILQAKAKAKISLTKKEEQQYRAKLDAVLGKERDELRALMRNLYATHLAKAAAKPVYSAPPGTGSVHEGEENTDTSGAVFNPVMMHVELSQHKSQLRFYKEMGVDFIDNGAFKPTNSVAVEYQGLGRGYAIYKS